MSGNSDLPTSTEPIPLITNEYKDIAYEIIVPFASYIALASVLVFMLAIVISRLVITVETAKSDLILFNTTPQKHIELLVSKQTSNPSAMNNIHAAVALGLMVPPPNYEPPANNQNKLPNGISHQKLAESNSTNELAANARPKKSKW